MPPTDSSSSSLPLGSSLPFWIGERAKRHGQRVAVTFVGDDLQEHSWSYRELWERSCQVATLLPAKQADQPRALLLYPPGIDFIAGFLGCQLAGWTPVPTCYPRGGREMKRLDSIARDCQPSVILGDQTSLDKMGNAKLFDELGTIQRIATDNISPEDGIADRFEDLQIEGNDLALLQYTSGSTSEPKGVMVLHRNLIANLEAIRKGFRVEWESDQATSPKCGVFWLPFFHDMGLIGAILTPLYCGGRTVLMSPRSFLQRPIRWLEYICKYNASFSGAPNFAYQLCVDRVSPEQTDSLDLSCWTLAFSGAEPVLKRTVDDFTNRFGPCGFSFNAFMPCYGLAEATLLAACGDDLDQPESLCLDRQSLGLGTAKVVDQPADLQSTLDIINCGKPSAEMELMIVDPETKQVSDPMKIGEIWLRGPSVTAGYWQRAEENEQRFNARLADGRSGFCRTGDLGFLHNGDLYVTGRLKDLIIIGGRNLFPQDIENTVSQEMGRDAGRCAAFAVDDGRGEALALVAELPRNFDKSLYHDLIRSIRRAVIEVHEVDPRHVLLVRQATVPITSSGKIQRSQCRARLQSDEFKYLHRYQRRCGSSQTLIAMPVLPKNPTPNDRSQTKLAIESWMIEWLIIRGGVSPAESDVNRPFTEFGLDSMTSIEMSAEIEDWSGVEVTPVVAWDHPTVSQLSGYITNQIVGSEETADQKSDAPPIHPSASPL